MINYNDLSIDIYMNRLPEAKNIFANWSGFLSVSSSFIPLVKPQEVNILSYTHIHTLPHFIPREKINRGHKARQGVNAIVTQKHFVKRKDNAAKSLSNLTIVYPDKLRILACVYIPNTYNGMYICTYKL